MNALSFTLFGHVAVGLLAFGMLMFFYMISKEVKKVRKRGIKSSKRFKKFKMWLKKFEEFKKGWFYEI